MPVNFRSMEMRARQSGATIFLSGSIPDPVRWEGEFDVLEITDAVVALARAGLTRGYQIVTAAHPTIAPLLMYVAAEFPEAERSRVRIYQSLLFEDLLPSATRRFEAEGIGEVVWTQAVEGEAPQPGHWNESLRVMREQMLRESNPVAAAFIGGMEGIAEEFRLFRRLCPGRSTFAVARPGGSSASLVNESPEGLRPQLQGGSAYPTLWWNVIDHLEREQASA